MDVSKMSVTELKSMAFDELVKIDMSKQNLQTLTQAISQKQSGPEEKIDGMEGQTPA